MAEQLTSHKEKLSDAFHKAYYSIPTFEITVEGFHPHAGLDEVLAVNESAHITFISAYNPFASILKFSENQKRHLLLGLALKEHVSWIGCAGAKDHSWPEELGFMVLNLPESNIQKLLKQFEQAAAWQYVFKQGSRLIWNEIL